MTDMKMMEGKKFAVSISVMDCLGCGSCINVCPVKALSSVSFETQLDVQKMFDYGVSFEEPTDVIENSRYLTVIKPVQTASLRVLRGMRRLR